MKSILFRTATISMSLNVLLKGQLKFLNRFYDVTAVSGYDDFLLELKQREAVKIFDIKMKRQINPLADLQTLWKLYQYFIKEKPLIVHSITPKAGLLTMMAGKMAGVPIRMHTFTGLIFPTRKGMMQFILINIDRLLCSCATNVYPEGQGVKNDLINFKITKKPLKIIGNGNVNGIDKVFFDPELYNLEGKIELRQKLEILENDFIFIFVGRLVPDKGINELIDAFSNLKSKSKEVKLLLVGTFENEFDTLDLETIKAIYETTEIITVGFQPDIRPYLAISDVLVLPSYREGFPNVVLQAGAMALPCIVTDINGSNEVIIEGHNGIIIPVKDKEALYHAMAKILSDKVYYLSLKKDAREMIISRFEQQFVWEALLAEYKSLEKNV